MPLVAWGALAYASGLLAGFVVDERDAIALTGLVIAAALIALWMRHQWASATLVVAAGATLVALADARHERGCGYLLALRRSWELRIDAPAATGDVARGMISADGCTRRAT